MIYFMIDAKKIHRPLRFGREDREDSRKKRRTDEVRRSTLARTLGVDSK
jgi:hypothetical protein